LEHRRNAELDGEEMKVNPGRTEIQQPQASKVFETGDATAAASGYDIRVVF